MKSAPLAALLGALAFALASCGGGEDCTPEALQQKHQDLRDAMTAALANDPAKATANPEAWGKALDLMAKAQSAGASPSQDICRAYDEQIEAVRKQSS
ncbi:hypothetical protein ACMDCR_21015 [Labrys okinawensis]|uniref:hypothetical protein n=1 Tax=Labrys okinawensis TaxID=346911 RepID=UPI0039BCA602